MARTFIGQLILRLQAQGLGEAKRVESAVGQIERAARRLSAAPWGATFQRQLDKLGASTQQIHAVRQSWTRLHEDMNRRGLSDAMKKSDIAAWKVATLGHFSAVRSGFDETERRAKQFSKNLQSALRPAMVMMGFYTGIYGAGILGREALTASSERRREVFRFNMANVPEADQDKLFAQSEALGSKYPSIPVTGIMEMARHAYALMGDAERGAAVLERMVQSFVTLQSVKGVDTAVQQLTGLLRGMDNLGVNKDGQEGIDRVNELIDAATRAAQVDPDFDPGTFFSFARRSKVAGPALSPEFLARASVFMQDMGPDTAGNALGMAFKAFVLEAVGSAGGKKYLEERDRLGIRQGGKIVDGELFGSDPDEWVVKHLIPALERDGVDLSNETAVATAIGKLSGNTNATGLLTRIVTQREQIERWLRLMDNATGTEVAGDVRFNDPFVAWEAFKKSLENLSSEVLPIDSIASGLNSLADTINRFKNAVKEGDPRVVNTALGAGALAAAWGTWKITTGIWGLITAGAALNTAAVSLQAAAVSLGAAGGAGDLVDGGKPKKPGSFFGALLTRAPWIAALLTAGSTADNSYRDASPEERARMRQEAREAAEMHNMRRYGSPVSPDEDDRNRQAEIDREASLDSFLGGPPMPAVGGALDEAKARAAEAGQSIQESLSVSATPTVNTSGIDDAIEKAKQLLSLLRQSGEAAVSASANADAELRRTFSDYGVAP